MTSSCIDNCSQGVEKREREKKEKEVFFFQAEDGIRDKGM